MENLNKISNYFIVIITNIVASIIMAVWYVWMPGVKKITSARRQRLTSFSTHINVILTHLNLKN